MKRELVLAKIECRCWPYSRRLGGMLRQAGEGRKHMVTTGRFRESEFHWPLSGYEFEERTVATRP